MSELRPGPDTSPPVLASLYALLAEVNLQVARINEHLARDHQLMDGGADSENRAAKFYEVAEAARRQAALATRALALVLGDDVDDG